MRSNLYLATAPCAIVVAIITLSATSQSSGQTGALVRLQSTTPGTAQAGHANVTGTIRAGQFQGDGSLLTGIDAASITTGVLDDSVVGPNIARRNLSNTFIGANTFQGGFVGVGRSFQVPGSESFGVGSNNPAFDGMYVRTASAGLPFYGYSLGGAVSAYHYVDGSDSAKWKLVVGSSVPITATNNGFVGIGKMNPVARLDVFGKSQFVSDGSQTDDATIFADATGTTGNNFGGWFRNASTGGTGVFGQTTAVSGTTYGGFFRTASNGGIGVQAISNHASGITKGLVATVLSPSGTAVEANSPSTGPSLGLMATGGTGVYGYSQRAGGAGLYGVWNGASTVVGYGGRFLTTSTEDAAVLVDGQYFGLKARVPGDIASAAVYGETFGTHPATIGVYGQSGGLAGVYGVRAVGSSAWAVYAIGNSGASGTKSFNIDHPLDPENSYLRYYSAEGPEPLNIYSGTIITNAQGYATIQLPEVFDRINKDPRVQLTVDDSGEDFVFAKVVGGVQDGACRIRTSRDSVKVYWEIKAVRNDLWVQRYGAPVEVTKPQEFRGGYQHPELYGHGQDRSEWEVAKAKSKGQRTNRKP